MVSLRILGNGLALAAMGGCASHHDPVPEGSLHPAIALQQPAARSQTALPPDTSPDPGSADPTAHHQPLTSQPGDAQRGRAIVADRTRGLCLLCHEGPFPEVRQGNLAPPLDGAGTRLTQAQLRARIVDARAGNPASIMPPYHVTDGQRGVAASLRGRPVLAAQEIEDVVAFLMTLREPPNRPEVSK